MINFEKTYHPYHFNHIDVNFSSVIHSIFGPFSVDALNTSFLGAIMNGLALK